MRRVLGVAAVIYSIAVVGSAGAAVDRASLQLLDDSAPPTLRGAGFGLHEHVRVVVVAGTTRTVRRTIATVHGRFALVLRATSLKRAPGQCPRP
jgi:hypothetical protein